MIPVHQNLTHTQTRKTYEESQGNTSDGKLVKGRFTRQVAIDWMPFENAVIMYTTMYSWHKHVLIILRGYPLYCTKRDVIARRKMSATYVPTSANLVWSNCQASHLLQKTIRN